MEQDQDNREVRLLYRWMSLPDLSDRIEDFMDFSGLSRDDLVVSRFSTLPIPLYPDRWPEGRNRWKGVKLESMWHPLMWLSGDLESRFIDDDDNIESDDLWCLRVLVEMEARGLYNNETGEWIDILALNGIDLEDPETALRLETWLAGDEDPMFERVTFPDPDLPDEIISSPEWSLVTAQQMIPHLALIYISSDAAEFIEAIAEVAEGIMSNDDEVSPVGAYLMSNIAQYINASFERFLDTDPEWWAMYSTRMKQEYGDPSSNSTQRVLEDPLLHEAMDRLEVLANLYKKMESEAQSS